MGKLIPRCFSVVAPISMGGFLPKFCQFEMHLNRYLSKLSSDAIAPYS